MESEKTAQSTPQFATLHVDDRRAELPIKSGTLGPNVVDIQRLSETLGVFTLDPGYACTAAYQSGITFIDGDEGILLHRGYPIEQLATQSTYLETAYLLLYGELPSPQCYDKFVGDIKHKSLLHEQIRNFFNGFRRDTHPMAIICGTVAALSGFYADGIDISNKASRDLSARRLVAKIPTIAAWAYRYTQGEAFIYPDESLSYADNFLSMMFARPSRAYRPNPIFARAIDRIFILHADHEQNASTSTVRLVGSTGANPFACIAAGIAALWGPAHGGANEAVLSMLRDIGERANIPSFIDKVKRHEQGARLMGFGHRVYKSFDPRAKIMEQTYREVVAELGIDHDPLFDLAAELEEIASNDPYFKERRLYPNVDFYSGLILRALGVPTSMFTVLFAVARTVGWVSHWLEMTENHQNRIGRPRQLYVGSPRRDYFPIEDRKS